MQDGRRFARRRYYVLDFFDACDALLDNGGSKNVICYHWY